MTSQEDQTGGRGAMDLRGARSFGREITRNFISQPGDFAILAVGLLLESLFTATVPICFRYLLDHAIAQRDRDALLTVVLALGIGVVVVSSMGLLRDYRYARFMSRLLNGLRRRLFDHITRLSMSYFSRAKAADIMARFSTDMASVDNALSAAISWGVIPALDVLFSYCLLMYLDWRLALVASLVFPVSLLGPRLVISRATAATYRRKVDEALAMGNVQESVAMQPVVKAFGLDTLIKRRFEERLAGLNHSSVRTSFLGSVLERSSAIGTLVLQVVVLGIGGMMAFSDQISIGTLAAFQTVFLTLSFSLGYVSQYFPFILDASAGMRRIDELLEVESQVADPPVSVEMPRLEREIAFRDVTFGYTPGNPVLKGASFVIGKGESAAFVGASGSGKSTVLNLLLRFYDADSGSVTLDGREVREVTQAALRAQMAVVFQDSILFDTTIRENIRMGKLDASDAEIEVAARAAEIHELIMKMPRGYDTVVGERGGQLSGGQRQRIAIARAIIRDPQVLLLDEATSALDAGTETAINATLKQVAQGRTVVSVTHRLSSVTGMSRIFVLDHGLLVEQGTHEELLQKNGVYARLWHKQHAVTAEPEGDRISLRQSHLRTLPMFESLTDAHLRDISVLFITERMLADREMFRQGDPGEKLYFIVRGRVRVYSESAEGTREIAILSDGDVFGEMALLGDTPRNATVRTLTDCTFLTLPRDAFATMLARDSTLRANFEDIRRSRENSLLGTATEVEDRGDI